MPSQAKMRLSCFLSKKLLMVVPCAHLLLTSVRGAFSGSLKRFGFLVL